MNFRPKRFLFKLLFSFVFGNFLVSLAILLFGDVSLDQFKSSIWDILQKLIVVWQFWVFIMLIFGLVELVLLFTNIYKKSGFKRLINRFVLFVIIPLLGVVGLFKISQFYVNGEVYDYTWNHRVENKSECASNFYAEDGKQRGVHVFGKIDERSLRSLIQNNFEWITFTPYIGQDHFDGTLNKLSFSPRQKSRDSILTEKIALAHNRGLKVFLKPHIWLSSRENGKWRSDIFPKNESTWREWSSNYREHLLHFAKIAEENNVELLCIGTELSLLTIKKPNFWKQMITEVKSVYSGQLTYGANWDEEYDSITFWEDLDFIGIQAYFPLVQKGNASLEAMEEGWKAPLKKMRSVSQMFGKPVIFTELGYKSTLDAASRPWRWITFYDRLFTKASLKTQANAYRAFFNTIWKEEWFYGVHVWKWQTNNSSGIFEKDHSFTIQDKPGQNIIAIGFAPKNDK
ncbi:glycoside hydrolase family 113 [Flagellimonas lutimaris]|uniref:glycoside hydrolase family 113 n=1 Tax=Flagellimonas lutimaris TaxID=475082 RepID=UPI003F5CDF87